MNRTNYYPQQPLSLWNNNPVLVQLLGLSPVLAISTSITKGLALGMASVLVLLLSSVTVNLLKHQINQSWRWLWFGIIAAAATSFADLVMQFYFFPLSKELGIYLPLICCNVMILLRLESSLRTKNLAKVVIDNLIIGFGFLIIILLLAAIREALSTGGILSNLDLLRPKFLGPSIDDNENQRELLRFARLPPAAFIILGLIIAAKNLINSKRIITSSKIEIKTSNTKRERV
jgi:electron transport complex protein RnfE